MIKELFRIVNKIYYLLSTDADQRRNDNYIKRQKEYHRKLLEQQTYNYLRNR